MPTELHRTEALLLAAGLLLLAGAFAGRIANRTGFPVLVLFLAVGMLAGSEGLGGIAFEDYTTAYRVGTVALVVILFDGGLRTPLSVVRLGIAPASALATLGVLVTAAIVGAVAHALGLSWHEGWLLGAIVSSTDAAAVFSVLRGGGVHLKERVGAVVELESGLNDPMAVLLTVALVTASAEGGDPHPAALAGSVVVQLAIGLAAGAAIGIGAGALLSRARLRVGGLYPVLALSLAFIAYGVASLASGSGFLAVYVAGVALGDARLPARHALLRAHDFIAWTGQIVMFVALGLLVFPSRVLAVAPAGLVVAAALAFVARPLAVLVCLAPFGFRAREIALVGWVGLRGAVPIILAVIPVLARVPGAETIFDVVFFVVLVSAILQGSTTLWLTERLALATKTPPRPVTLVDIESARPLDDDLLSFFIAEPSAVCGVRLADIPFPEGSFVMLIVRADELVAPKGDVVLEEGDHVFVFCRRGEAPFARLLFGRAEEA